MFERLFRKNSNACEFVGFSLSDAGLALAQVLPQPNGKPRLTFCDFLSRDSSEERSLFAEGCQRLGLTAGQAVCTLEMGSYQLLQVAPPEVPENELRDAIRWQIRDLIDFPLEEAVVDVFHVPRGNQRERARTAYVAVARQSVVEERIRQMREARLKIRAVDIPELVLRNLLNLLPDSGRGVGLLYFGTDSGLVVLTRGGELCLARNLPFGTRSLAGDGGHDMPLDSIALEVQRSFDFYERSFAQVPIGSLFVAPQEFDIEPLLSGLRFSLGVDVATLDLEQMLECSAPLPSHAGRCLLAIGAALRSEEAGA